MRGPFQPQKQFLKLRCVKQLKKKRNKKEKSLEMLPFLNVLHPRQVNARKATPFSLPPVPPSIRCVELRSAPGFPSSRAVPLAARCPLPAAPSHCEPRASQPHAGLGQSQRPHPQGHCRRARLTEGLPAPSLSRSTSLVCLRPPPVPARGCSSSRGRWPRLLHRESSGRRRRAGQAVGPPGPGERRSAPGGGLCGARRERQSGGFPGSGCPAELFPCAPSLAG